MVNPDEAIRALYPDAADDLLQLIETVDDLSIRAINCCTNAGLVRVYDLLQYSPRDLLDVRRGRGRLFGPKTVAELKLYMEKIGAPMKPNPQEAEA
jgi:DNA-directed RNA polymerase alpha subunit